MGGPGGSARDGVYHEFCREHGIDFYDFNAAKQKFGRANAFKGACTEALSLIGQPDKLYDAILVDEAQDFPPEFLRLCFLILDRNRRLVYAYDELQNLSGTGVPPAEEIFGEAASGEPLVSFDDSARIGPARRDIILEKCYRNSRPVLLTAHALGFGTYREPAAGQTTGLVQMFDNPALWTEIGYTVGAGELAPGHNVTLIRTPETSPRFLEDHSAADDLVSFHSFDAAGTQNEWVAAEIETNLGLDELRHDDIVVVNTDPITTRSNLGPIRKALLDRRIQSHLAGVETSADVFFQPDEESVTFTGIFRAKGNEAGMVYVVNAQECHSQRGNLALLRNRLFTAITRSKAWVRVCGFGSNMDELVSEFDRVRSADYRLRFKYPTAREQAQLQVVHRDLSREEQKLVEQRRRSLGDLVSDLEAGTIYPEDLDEDLLSRLRGLVARDED